MTMIKNATTLTLLVALAPIACSMAGEGTSNSASATVSAGPASASDGDTTSGSTGTGTDTGGGSAGTDTEGGGACGDGVLDPGEVCDGAALGGQTCAGLGDPYVGGELGCAAGCAAFDASGCEVDENAPIVVLNELLSKGASEGPYAAMGDVIELYNAGGSEADLSGWLLSDDPEFAADKTYTFPPGTKLAAGAWMVLLEYDDVAMSGDFPFGISSSNDETISLADGRGVIADAITFNGALAEVSYCRIADGDENWQGCLQTPGEANKAEGGETCGDGTIDPGEECDGDALDDKTCADVGDFDGGALACSDACAFDTSGCTKTQEIVVVLNEISSSDVDPIEIHNAGDAEVDISGWLLTDDTSDPYDPDADAEELVFPGGTVIPAGGFLVVNKGTNPDEHPFGLAAAGDSVRLFDADLVEVDAATYGDQEAVTSYCRLPDGPDGTWTVDCTATFGASNKG
ncbi:MAG: lamin tail domain-containing protein [Myxococcales bacterium]|nr:lamin tail domain-containing protein [Myxococcales bacterium]